MAVLQPKPLIATHTNHQTDQLPTHPTIQLRTWQITTQGISATMKLRSSTATVVSSATALHNRSTSKLGLDISTRKKPQGTTTPTTAPPLPPSRPPRQTGCEFTRVHTAAAVASFFDFGKLARFKWVENIMDHVRKGRSKYCEREVGGN